MGLHVMLQPNSSFNYSWERMNLFLLRSDYRRINEIGRRSSNPVRYYLHSLSHKYTYDSILTPPPTDSLVLANFEFKTCWIWRWQHHTVNIYLLQKPHLVWRGYGVALLLCSPAKFNEPTKIVLKDISQGLFG